MAGLKRSEKLSRTLKIHLNGKLNMDSNGVDYNLRGNVIARDFVEDVEHVRLTDTHILTLRSEIHVDDEVVVAQNTREECIRLYANQSPHTSMLLPTKHIEKVELTESIKVTLIP